MTGARRDVYKLLLMAAVLNVVLLCGFHAIICAGRSEHVFATDSTWLFSERAARTPSGCSCKTNEKSSSVTISNVITNTTDVRAGVVYADEVYLRIRGDWLPLSGAIRILDHYDVRRAAGPPRYK